MVNDDNKHANKLNSLLLNFKNLFALSSIRSSIDILLAIEAVLPAASQQWEKKLSPFSLLSLPSPSQFDRNCVQSFGKYILGNSYFQLGRRDKHLADHKLNRKD